MNVSIILVTYNEKGYILRMINELKKHIKNLKEIIVVDDNSPDGTWKLVEDLNDKQVKLIRRMNERGLASAFKRGFEEVSGDIICWLDCDLCQPPSKLSEMIKYVGDYDVVIGSRYVKDGRDIRDFVRKASSKSISLFAGLLFGFDFKDYTSGFAAVKREVFDKVEINPEGYAEYFIDFIVKCKKNKFKIKEIGYVFKDRDIGVSKSAPSAKVFLKNGWTLGIKMLKLRLGFE